MKSLFEPHINLTAKVLDLQLERQNVINSNLANINTEGYKPRKLEFEKELQAALGLDARGKLTRTNPKHLPAHFDPNSFEGDLKKEFKPRIIHGEDRVNLDKEMTAMAKNQLEYSALSNVIRSNFDGIRNIIAEGQK